MKLTFSGSWIISASVHLKLTGAWLDFTSFLLLLYLHLCIRASQDEVRGWSKLHNFFWQLPWLHLIMPHSKLAFCGTLVGQYLWNINADAVPFIHAVYIAYTREILVPADWFEHPWMFFSLHHFMAGLSLLNKDMAHPASKQEVTYQDYMIYMHKEKGIKCCTSKADLNLRLVSAAAIGASLCCDSWVLVEVWFMASASGNPRGSTPLDAVTVMGPTRSQAGKQPTTTSIKWIY